jgi:C1A family cysteine protease
MGNQQSIDYPLKIRKTKKYGCIPDIPDQRDIFTNFPSVKYYQSVDLRKSDLFPEIPIQGELGASVAHALIAYNYYNNKKNGNVISPLSAQFIYYNQRTLANTIDSDSGGSIRDGLKILERIGICEENIYPYSPEFFRDPPTKGAYENALKNKQIIQYRRLKLEIEEIMKSLSIKIPVILGFTVYESFEHPDVARTGIMPIPKLGEKIIGYHATLIVGYNIDHRFFLCRNTRGPKWGQSGHFWMPFSFVNTKHCGDPWIMSTGYNKVSKSPVAPSVAPSVVPSVAPSVVPSVAPSVVPSVAPSVVNKKTIQPVQSAFDKYPLMRPIEKVEKVEEDLENLDFKQDDAEDEKNLGDELLEDFESVI